MTPCKRLPRQWVQTNFGAVADIVKGGQPVTITHHGRPRMMLSRYEDAIDFSFELDARRERAKLDC